MGLNYNPASVIDGLVYYLDIMNTRCYSGTGNTLYNLAERVLPFDSEKKNDILVEFDANTFNQEDFFYYKVLFESDTPKGEPKLYYVESYPAGGRVGENGNPIKWYEYQNP